MHCFYSSQNFPSFSQLLGKQPERNPTTTNWLSTTQSRIFRSRLTYVRKQNSLSLSSSALQHFPGSSHVKHAAKNAPQHATFCINHSKPLPPLVSDCSMHGTYVRSYTHGSNKRINSRIALCWLWPLPLTGVTWKVVAIEVIVRSLLHAGKRAVFRPNLRQQADSVEAPAVRWTGFGKDKRTPSGCAPHGKWLWERKMTAGCWVNWKLVPANFSSNSG